MQNQKGFFQLLFLLIILLAIPIGVYLVLHPAIFRPKAAEESKSAVDQELGLLSDQILEDNNQYNLNTGDNISKKAELLDKIKNKLKRRGELLLKLVKDNPKKFLENAKLKKVKNKFPDEVREFIEQDIDIEGNLTIFHEDDFKNRKNTDKLVLEEGSGKKMYNLNFADNSQPKAKGQKVKVKGVALENNVVLENSKSGNLETVQEASQIVISNPKLAVFLVKFQDSKNFNVDANVIKSIVFDSAQSIKNYYLENSYQQLNISGNVFGWYQIPYIYKDDNCRFDQWEAAAMNAARNSGVDLSSYTHYMFIWSDRLNFPCAGTYGMLPGNKTWANGLPFDDVAANTQIATSVYSGSLSHELGHNFGMHHANSLSCPPYQLDIYDKCRNLEYGDLSDVMGGHFVYFNAVHKFAMGWISPQKMQTVTSNGLYVITPLELNTSSTQILKINKPDTNESYFVSYRQPIGLDSLFPLIEYQTKGITDGVSIHIWREDSLEQTKIIDSTPEEDENKDYFASLNAALSDGRYFYDQINKLLIKQISHNKDFVQVEIKFNVITPPPSISPSPSPTIKPSSCDPKKFNKKTWTNSGVSCDPGKPGYEGEKWTCQDSVVFKKYKKNEKVCGAIQKALSSYELLQSNSDE